MQFDQHASSSVAPPPHIVSDETLVYHLDIFLLIIIAVFFLLNVPRALLYLVNNGSEAFQGYLLCSTSHLRAYQTSSAMSLQSTEKEKEPLDSPTLPSLESAAVPKEPWHLPMYISLRQHAASFMQYRVFGNYTVLQTLLMAGYTGAVFYAAFYESDPFSDPRRAGWVIASQFPFVYAFATKNNVIGLLIGVGYEKLNYLHRHVGRLMVIGANVHAIGYIYKWTMAGDISQKIAEPYVRWGIVALTCFDLLGFFSMERIRTRYYNVFFGTHAVGLVVLLFAACFHRPVCIPFVIAASAVYGLDHIVRVIRTRFATAAIRTVPELGLTQVHIPSVNAGWRAGQHVRLRVLSTAMGFWGMSEVHPFTIASATNTEQGLVLMCRKTGYWTKRLYDMAHIAPSGEEGQRLGRTVKVIIEGPYGGVGDTTIPNYSGAMFVVGGSGVTFALSAVQDLVLASDRSRIRVIEVVWCITDPAALEKFIPLFETLVSRSETARLRVSVFYTRATTRSFEGRSLPPGITLTPGRPKIRKVLDEFAGSIMGKGSAHGAFVGVCGPLPLAKDVAHTVRTFDTNLKKAVGGIQFHEETFGW